MINSGQSTGSLHTAITTRLTLQEDFVFGDDLNREFYDAYGSERFGTIIQSIERRSSTLRPADRA